MNLKSILKILESKEEEIIKKNIICLIIYKNKKDHILKKLI
jgi:hypothetical protein